MMMRYLSGYMMEGALDADRDDIASGDIEEVTWLDRDILECLCFSQEYLDSVNM